jgi:hypothetical protein
VRLTSSGAFAVNAAGNSVSLRPYLLLILDYWRNGPAPDDDAVLQQITKCDAKTWKKHRPAMARLFQISDGEWHHKRIEAELASAATNAERRSTKAKSAAEARWGQSPKGAPSNAPSMPEALLGECPPQSPSPKKNSDTDVSGAAAPPKPVDPEKVMFDQGRALLAEAGVLNGKAGTLLGKWKRDHGAEAVIVALGKAQREGAIDPLVGGVVLGTGDYETRSAVQVPTGKFLTGAGRWATRLVAAANIAALANVGKGVIISNGTIGARIGNLTAVAPKSTGVNGDKVQGVWMRNAKKWVVENIETYNCGYAFWAHERSEDGIFRNLASYNANVHFETTQAYRILFEDLVSGDGDGDNPLGFEAVWHCLLASRNITFRRARHTGSGCPFLIIANDTNGDTQGGLIDDIRYEDCQAINTDGKLGMQIANFNNLPVGRVALVDSGVEYADRTKAGVPAILSLGKVSMRGGRWKSFSQENFIIYAPASLDAIDVEVTVDANPAATGIVYNSEGPTRIGGGKITMTTASMTIGAGATLYVSPTTKIVTPNATYEPVGVGQRVSFVYPSDIAKASGYDGLLARFGTVAGRTYRVMLAGKQRKDGADGSLAFFIDPASGPIASTGFGRVEMQDAAGTYQPTSDTKLLAAANGNIRAFNMDLTFVGTGNQVSINFGGGDAGATILAGARLSVERLA